MPPLRRSLAACALAALPSLALAQSALLKPDGSIRYALGVGASYLSGTTATAATANIGGEGAFGTPDNRWRFGGKALWSRSGSQSMSESITVMLVAESQHRWQGETWFRQRLALFPATRAGEGVRGILDTGLAIAMSPLCSVNVGVTQRYDSIVGMGDTQFVTAIAMKLR
ncbi:MAG: hypothetical protein ABIQ33_09815 [Caldimonas sp.]